MPKPKAENRLPFSKERLAALPVPDKGRIYHHDTKQPGLTLCVTQAGTRTYYLYRWVHGRPSRIRIGRFPELSVEQARGEARRLIGEIATGKDPQTERISKRGEPTLQQAWEHWVASATPRCRPRTIREATIKYDLYLKPWGSRRLSSITKDMVVRLHASIGNGTFPTSKKDKRRRGGPVAANQTVRFLSGIFHEAEGLGYRGDNPCRGVREFPTSSRERFLQADEVGPFLAACEAEEPPWRDFWPMLLWTGARKGNVCTMKWKDLDLDRCLWFVRGAETKRGKPLTIVLPPPAVEILDRRRAENHAGSEWVFWMDHSSGHVPHELKHHWDRLMERAGLVGLVPHDLRRTLGSWQALGGSSLQVIGKSLGHANVATTEIYSRLLVDPVRASVNGAVAALLAAGKRGDDAEAPEHNLGSAPSATNSVEKPGPAVG